MSHVYENAALRILDWLHQAERDLIGAPVVTFNGEAGTVKAIKLDEHHGLCFTIDEPVGVIDDCRRFYPVSTIRQKERPDAQTQTQA